MDPRVNFGGEAMILRPRITKEKLEALIKAVEEGGDDDDEITEDEAIAILQDTGLDAEIPFVRNGLPGSGLEIAHSERAQQRPHQGCVFRPHLRRAGTISQRVEGRRRSVATET